MERPLEPTSPSAGDDRSVARAVRIASLQVKRDRIIARVMVDPACAYTTPCLARRLVQARPQLPAHACVNLEGTTFGAVLDHTSLPHVLEHLVIDLQVQGTASTAPDVVFTGTTRWTDWTRGVAEVAVSYRDDVVAIRAFRDALNLLNSLRYSGANPPTKKAGHP